jgi:TolB protein
MLKYISLILLISFSLRADEGLTVVAIGEAEAEKDKIVFVASQVPSNATAADQALINEIQTLFENDFSFYRQKFEVIKPAGYEALTASKNYSGLAARGVRYFVLTSFEKSSNSTINLDAQLFDVRDKQRLEQVRVSFSAKDIRQRGHEAADVIYQKLSGQTSIFRSRIIFVSDKNSRGGGNDIKELYVMDFDGRNRRQLTFHKGTVISPAFSFDGKKVLYSLITNSRSKNRNVNLRILDVETGKSRTISKKKGINSGAVFMPDGEHITLTMSHEGNAELYALNLKSGRTRRMTKHFAPDVDPSINVSGSKMAFLSGRSGAGKPMIYVADPRSLEKDVKRISYVGKFNATPRFSPDGSQIAFSSWVDNRFDIFRLDENGENLHRLTKDFGSNEDPTYSNDGQFIAFSSQRVLSRSKAVQNIYIMTSEGEILGEVTKNFGNCSTPRWSKY